MVDSKFLVTFSIILSTQLFVPFMYVIFDYKNGCWPFELNAWKIAMGFMIIQLILMLTVPGKKYDGPEAKGEHTNWPTYYDNGFTCYCMTMILVVACIYLGYIDGLYIYNELGNIFVMLDVFGLAFCTFLYIKGRYFTQNMQKRANWAQLGDSGFITDFYDGIETYPQIG